jgi:phospholipid/cholesterol/gamma-HCH transport system ATP-binding protein
MLVVPITKRIRKISTGEVVIRISGLAVSFGTNHVLNDFSIELLKGENLAVLGRSGSGKSVLIKCIIGLIEPDSGEIEVLGKDLRELKPAELDELRVDIGFLFQSNALYDSMTVRENLEFPLRRHWMNINQEEINKMVIESLNDVGLLHTVDMMPVELSGGMRKRIALARTLILRPQVILYDEPTTGLDPITGKEISNLIADVGKKYNTSSIIISHDMNCIRRTADRIAILYEGRCYTQGKIEILESSKDKIVNQFFE